MRGIELSSGRQPGVMQSQDSGAGEKCNCTFEEEGLSAIVVLVKM